MTDYYSILGVSKDADAAALKSAYKKKAMEHHPDRGGDENKFKQLNEAYDVLKDPQKKAMYDTYGTVDSQGPGRNQWRGGDPFGSTGNHGFHFRTGGPGDFEHVFRDIFGQGFQQARRQTNMSYQANIGITLEDAYNGATVPINIQNPDGSQKTLNVKIPRGVDTGVKIKLAGQGSKDIPAVPPGDLIVTVVVQANAQFHRVGADLVIHKERNFVDAALGTKITITPMDGKNVTMTVPPGTQNGQKLRLQGKGMPILNESRSGDLFVNVLVKVPVNLTEKQKELLKEFQKSA
jgi:curved DNA-binding protein